METEVVEVAMDWALSWAPDWALDWALDLALDWALAEAEAEVAIQAWVACSVGVVFPTSSWAPMAAVAQGAVSVVVAQFST